MPGSCEPCFIWRSWHLIFSSLSEEILSSCVVCVHGVLPPRAGAELTRQAVCFKQFHFLKAYEISYQGPVISRSSVLFCWHSVLFCSFSRSLKRIFHKTDGKTSHPFSSGDNASPIATSCASANLLFLISVRFDPDTDLHGLKWVKRIRISPGSHLFDY